jgi:hypothetical protein
MSGLISQGVGATGSALTAIADAPTTAAAAKIFKIGIVIPSSLNAKKRHPILEQIKNSIVLPMR